MHFFTIFKKISLVCLFFVMASSLVPCFAASAKPNEQQQEGLRVLLLEKNPTQADVQKTVLRAAELNDPASLELLLSNDAVRKSIDQATAKSFHALAQGKQCKYILMYACLMDQEQAQQIYDSCKDEQINPLLLKFFPAIKRRAAATDADRKKAQQIIEQQQKQELQNLMKRINKEPIPSDVVFAVRLAARHDATILTDLLRNNDLFKLIDLASAQSAHDQTSNPSCKNLLLSYFPKIKKQAQN